jgi:dihydroflavonol-4-reductase
MEFVSDHVTHRPPAGTVEGVRIALRSQSLSTEKSRRELGYAPNPIGPALERKLLSAMAALKREFGLTDLYQVEAWRPWRE